jgi:3-oxoacyl-[acyl-carrier-protein] synthase-3
MKLIKPNININILNAVTNEPRDCEYSNEEILSFDPKAKFLPKFAREKLGKSILKKFGFGTRHMIRKPGDVPNSPEAITNEILSQETIKKCFNDSGKDIDFFVHGTTTTSRYTGSQATSILSAVNQLSPCIEMKAGCSTSLASMYAATLGLMAAHDNVMVLCTETLSKVVNPKDRETWFGLGDASSAIWMEKSTDKNADFKLEAMTYGTNGHHVDMFTTRGTLPPTKDELDDNKYVLTGDGAALKELSLNHYNKMYKLFSENYNMSDIDYLIPHQVNDALIRKLMKNHFDMPNTKILKSSDRVGNIGGSSVLYTLSENLRDKKFKSGDKILLMSVGGGLSYSMHLWEKL